MTILAPTLADQIVAAGQPHLLDHGQSLGESARQEFVSQLRSVDWIEAKRLIGALSGAETAASDDVLLSADHLAPPKAMIRLPATPLQLQQRERATAHGEELLRAGRVGVIVVAGGQGTRLGFDQPKGLFPFGPVSGKTLFQWFFEQLLARRRRAGQAVPYAIMTSDATHDATARFLAEHDFFGLPADDVFLFRQGNMPAVDATTKQVLLAAPGRLALSPDGHGGMLSAMNNVGILKEWAARGIDTLFYHQVDNPATIVADPVLLGYHAEQQADVTTQVVAKRHAAEKMGVLVDHQGVTRIIEYSSLPTALADSREPDGSLRIWAGNTAIHVFRRSFLEQALVDPTMLPFHAARKVVPYLDADGQTVQPRQPNAWKFERFIFDILPKAGMSLVVEGDRARIFFPIKNGSGDDSPETARAALVQLHRGWLQHAGVQIADDVPVEISPLVALRSEDLQGRFPEGMVLTEPTYLNSSRMADLFHKRRSA